MTVNCNRHFLADRESPARVLPSDWPYRQASAFLMKGHINWHVQTFAARRPTPLTLLLLHGTGASTHSWSELIEPIRQFACVIAPDLPGHGFTRGATATDLTLSGMASALQDLIVAMNVQGPLVVVGHSAGAPLAIEWALQEGGAKTNLFTIQKIIGLNPSLVPPPTLYTSLLGPMVAPIATSSPMTGLLAYIAANTAMVDQLLDSTGSAIPTHSRRHYRFLFSQSQHVQGAMGFMAGADLPAMLERSKRLTIPTAFLLGKTDPWVKEEPLQKVIATSFPKASVTVWPGGHVLHETEPKRVSEYLQTIALTT